MTSSDRLKSIISLTRRRLKSHLNDRDPDGFFICHVMQERNTIIAPKGEYFGTEKEREQAIRDRTKMLENITCDYCELCYEIIRKSSPRNKRDL